MSFDPIIAVRMEAFSCAMRAKVNDLPAQDVDLLVARAEEALPSSDPFFQAITNFATQHQLARHNAAALAELGDALNHAIAVANMPNPICADRADIHG